MTGEGKKKDREIMSWKIEPNYQTTRSTGTLLLGLFLALITICWLVPAPILAGTEKVKIKKFFIPNERVRMGDVGDDENVINLQLELEESSSEKIDHIELSFIPKGEKITGRKYSTLRFFSSEKYVTPPEKEKFKHNFQFFQKIMDTYILSIRKHFLTKNILDNDFNKEYPPSLDCKIKIVWKTFSKSFFRPDVINLHAPDIEISWFHNQVLRRDSNGLKYLRVDNDKSEVTFDILNKSGVDIEQDEIRADIAIKDTSLEVIKRNEQYTIHLPKSLRDMIKHDYAYPLQILYYGINQNKILFDAYIVFQKPLKAKVLSGKKFGKKGTTFRVKSRIPAGKVLLSLIENTSKKRCDAWMNSSVYTASPLSNKKQCAKPGIVDQTVNCVLKPNRNYQILLRAIKGDACKDNPRIAGDLIWQGIARIRNSKVDIRGRKGTSDRRLVDLPLPVNKELLKSTATSGLFLKPEIRVAKAPTQTTTQATGGTATTIQTTPHPPPTQGTTSSADATTNSTPQTTGTEVTGQITPATTAASTARPATTPARRTTTTAKPATTTISPPPPTTTLLPPVTKKPVDLKKALETHQGKSALKIRGEYYHFVSIVEKNDYHLGMTYEQMKIPEFGPSNFGMYSSAVRFGAGSKKDKSGSGKDQNQGTVKISPVKPFLIMSTEVTWRQYLTYLKHFENKGKKPYRPRLARPVKEQDIGRPASGLSFLDIRKFIKWLQKDLDKKVPGLTIRLPHEFEWEMAARGVGRTQGYVWPLRRVNEARAELLGKKQRPVASSQIDRTSTGIFDLCGNVREWTTTVNNNTVLANMHLASTIGGHESGVLPWDPSDPSKYGWVANPPAGNSPSQLMVVRGGASNDKLVFMMISLRRNKEWSSRDDWIGFRLVLVPKKGYDIAY